MATLGFLNNPLSQGTGENQKNLCHVHPKWRFTSDSRVEDNGDVYIGVYPPDGSVDYRFDEGFRIGAKYADGYNPNPNGGENALYTVYASTNDSQAKYCGTLEKNHGAVTIYACGCGSRDNNQGCETVDNGTEYGTFTLLSPPVLNSIWNYSPHLGTKTGVSAYENKIDVGYSASGDAATSMNYAFEPLYSSWKNNGVVYPSPVSWNNLTPGTTYKAWIQLCNAAGNSVSRSITIRTLHAKPSINISHDHATQSHLETIEVSWASDKNIQQVRYSIDGSDWITYATGLDTKSGTIVINTKDGADLYENTEYQIKVQLKSTVTYDERWSESSEVITCRTDERAKLREASPRNLIIGDDLRIYKTNESGNGNEIRLYIADTESLWKYQTSPSNDYYISFSQSEWDTAYRRFITPVDASKSTDEHNRIKFKIRVVTYGRNREYTIDYTGYLIIKGNMLTTYTNVDGTVRRGKVWCNPSGGAPLRGVSWISTATGTWRRGI